MRYSFSLSSNNNAQNIRNNTRVTAQPTTWPAITTLFGGVAVRRELLAAPRLSHSALERDSSLFSVALCKHRNNPRICHMAGSPVAKLTVLRSGVCADHLASPEAWRPARRRTPRPAEMPRIN